MKIIAWLRLPSKFSTWHGSGSFSVVNVIDVGYIGGSTITVSGTDDISVWIQTENLSKNNEYSLDEYHSIMPGRMEWYRLLGRILSIFVFTGLLVIFSSTTGVHLYSGRILPNPLRILPSSIPQYSTIVEKFILILPEIIWLMPSTLDDVFRALVDSERRQLLIALCEQNPLPDDSHWYPVNTPWECPNREGYLIRNESCSSSQTWRGQPHLLGSVQGASKERPRVRWNSPNPEILWRPSRHPHFMRMTSRLTTGAQVKTT